MRYRSLGFLALLTAAASLRAAESAVPYAALYESLRPALEISSHDRLRALTRIVSKQTSVSPAQIRLEIRARDGVRRIAVGSDGDFEFPLDARLRDENPPVVSNQPKGSLTLSVAIVLKAPATTRFPYGEIARGVDQMRAVVAADGGGAALHVAAVELWFDPRAQAQLNVSGRIERLLMADHLGRIVLDDSAELREAGVMLALSVPPRRIVPMLRAQERR
ncbi:MAG: hypothetical protein IPH76_12900 [Xanthomonadales bacterium]|nr:hypothetical protein [Xanthomonadales bacterium]